MDFKLDIVIPSLNRKEKLINCLNSLFLACKNLTGINIYLYFSVESERKFFEDLIGFLPEIHCKIYKDYKVPEFWNSHIKEMMERDVDAILIGNDDILFFNDTIEKVIEKFKKDILNRDGILGLSQSNLPEGDTLEGAFSVIGSKYIKRFPDYKVWCPDYYRFRADWELWRHAKDINKFHFDPDIKIQHLHPAYYKDLIDTTHSNVRKYLARDNETFRQRQSRRLLWGKNFDLINKE